MLNNSVGKLFEVSPLTFCGGGIAQVWDDASRDEAKATVGDAYPLGTRLFDMAPLYSDGEAVCVLQLAFADGYWEGLRLATKCVFGRFQRSSLKLDCVAP